MILRDTGHIGIHGGVDINLPQIDFISASNKTPNLSDHDPDLNIPNLINS